MSPYRILALLAALVTVLLAGCGGQATSTGSGGTPSPGGATSASPRTSGTVTVFAAASLTEAFDEIAPGFAAANPGTTVRFNYGASSALAAQINLGAPADVFAAASPATMTQVTAEGRADGEPAVFVRNRLQIAVPRGNPGRVRGLADFANAGLRIALCAPQVPCGAAADKALAAARVQARPDTLEQDVKATLSKVELGEVDAALVYRTDVQAAGDAVEGIDFPEAGQAVNDYPMVVLRDAPNRTAAEAFVAYVRSEPARAVLARAGFESP